MRSLSTFLSPRSLASEDLWSEVDRFFDSVGTLQNHTSGRALLPATEVIECEDHFLLSLDIPGLKREDIKIEVADGILHISGERKEEERSKSQKVQRYEKSYGMFKRSFSLPRITEAANIEASYQDGVLEVYLPKTEIERTQKIEVKAGKSGFFDRLTGKKKEIDIQ